MIQIVLALISVVYVLRVLVVFRFSKLYYSKGCFYKNITFC